MDKHNLKKHYLCVIVLSSPLFLYLSLFFLSLSLSQCLFITLYSSLFMCFTNMNPDKHTTRTCTHAQTHTHTQAHTRTHTHTHTPHIHTHHTYTHAHTHTHTNTRTHTQRVYFCVLLSIISLFPSIFLL